jgi:hypothetical protein
VASVDAVVSVMAAVEECEIIVVGDVIEGTNVEVVVVVAAVAVVVVEADELEQVIAAVVKVVNEIGIGIPVFAVGFVAVIAGMMPSILGLMYSSCWKVYVHFLHVSSEEF